MPSRPKRLRVCTDVILPPELQGEAQLIAMEENPANVMPPAGGLDGRALELALLTEKKWPPGRVLRVRFLGGHPELQQKVAAVAQQWSQFANIKFEFGDDPEAEIRIAFMQGKGSWSAVGTDARILQFFPRDQPTMNFGWLTSASTDDEISRVVLHEFGHALGCIHEHLSPASGIQWNVPAVLDHYKRTNGWNEAKTRFNVLDRYSASVSQFTEFDPESIMVYAIPKELTLDGFEVKSNKTLSETDKAFIGTAYPF